ncbi:MAG TPA: Rpn family recombination-promoting nuclease/putative transposase, partial [Turneriella sp.]|nr:Rpn family recombination-promoting nuclease/putative transposase [Turneriella sp.]
DLLFTAQTKDNMPLNLYILLEHKSKPDKNILTQLLIYQKEIYVKQEKYAAVIPVVFYHGKEKWNIPKKFAEPHERLIKYALNFRYILINLSEYNFEKLKISLTARAILGIFQKIWYLEDEEIFKDYIRAIADLFSAENNAALLQKIFVYLYSVHTIEPIETRKRIEAVIAEKGDVAMSTAELLIERGIEKGIEKGIERGVEKNKLETARRMLDKGLSLNDILEITALSLDDLRAAGLISAD